MNKTYRTVWNPTTGTWVAAAETARARKKSNSTMRSSVTAAVAVMAGFGGGAIAIDAEAQTANGNGALNLCGGVNGAVGHTFGYSGQTVNANCAPIATNNPTYQGHAPSFVLGNGGDLNGASGAGATANTASVAGSRDGHVMIYGANGVHITGTTDFANGVSMTNNRIQNLAAGTSGTDAVNVNQLNAAIAATNDKYVAFSTGTYAADAAATVGGNSATAIGPNASATGISSVALGGNTVASGQNAVALGTLARTTGSEATAVGVGAAATGTAATALGRGAAATGNNSTALGTFASAVGVGNLAVGSGAAVAQTGRFVPSNMIAIGTGARAIDGDVTGANGAIAIGTSATAGGVGSIAIGTNARHSGSSATVLGGEASAMGGGGGVAVGYASMASGSSGVSLGTNATASAASSVALGTNSVANRANAVSVGSATQQRQIMNVAAGTVGTDAVNLNQLNAAIAAADDPYVNVRSGTYAPAVAAQAGNSATAIGANASGTGTSAVALGGSSTASADNAVALGTRAVATGINSIAAGVSSRANGNNTVALGSLAVAGTTNATAVGSGANASAVNTIALGQSSSASGLSAVGIGFRANAQADNSVALGVDSVANRVNTVSVGSASQRRQITNVAAGTQDYDAVNVAQLNAAIANVDGNSPYFKANGAGDGSDAASATGVGSVAIGSNAKTLVAGGVAIGGSATASMADSVAIGNDVIAAQDGVAIGQGARAQNANATAIGTKSAAGLNGTSLGTNAHAVTDAVALGVNATAAGGNSVALGNGSIAASNTVSVGSVGNERKITNVADGTLSDTSTDTVNGSQLFATNTRVGSLEDSLKGGGVIDPDTGESLAVVYDTTAKDKVTLGGGTDGTTLANVKAGVADMDAVNVSQLKGSGLIGDDGKAIAAVTYDRNTDGTTNYGSVTLGDGTNPTQLKHVADGVDRQDAVNLGQLQDSGLVAPVDPKNPGAGVTSLAVTYGTNADGSANFDEVKLKGTNGTTLANVKAGVADTDAVNVSQLKGSGLIGDDGKAIAAVTYDRNTDGTANYNAVTLGGGNSTGPVKVSNVAAGVAATDAVNVQQLQQSVANGNPYIGGRGTGVAAQATGLNAIALGLGSVADEIRTVSVGNSATGLQRRITNVQNGEADSDAATLGQVNDLLGVSSTNTQAAIDNVNTTTKQAIQDVNSRLDAIGTLAGTDPYVQVDGLGDGSDNAFVRPGTFGVAIGAEASATGDTSIAIGAQSIATGSGAVALGAGASAAATGAVALGHGSASGTNALALGNGTGATGNNAIAAGFNARAAGVNAIALGNTARANASDSLAFGTTAQVDPLATNSIAIGRQANVTSTALNSVALGSNSVADRLNSISVGSTGQQRQIIYVARGTENTDAVNVSQLKDAVAAFGGNAAVGADGSITNPTYTIGGTTYRNVGDALNALSNLGGGTNPLAVTYGVNGDGTPNFEVVTLKGTDGTTLSNVKAGVADTDAVNVSQLKDSGLIGDDGKAIAAVTYDRNADGTPNLGSVTLGGGTDGTTLSNVKAGVADKDAVNVSQLKGSGLIGDDGKSIAAVTYDRNTDGTPNYGSVTLGNGTNPTQLKHVADATDDGDALNLGQLKSSGLVGDDGNGNLTSLAVTYDSATKDKVTLDGGTDGTTLANVKAGVADKDAVNVSQLKGSGLIGDDGKSIAAVTYDRNTDGTPNLGSVTLAGGTDGTTLANVKAGVADKDAVNVSQLKGSGLIGDDGKSIAAVTYDRNTDGTPNLGSVTLGDGTNPTQLKHVADATDDGDALNLGQLKNSGLVGDDGNGNLTSLAVTYDSATKDTVTLGGGTDGTTLSNVKAGVADKDAVNVSQLKGSGLIGDDGHAIAAVTYNRNTDGTPNYNAVTLGAGKSTGAVTLSNVAEGVAGTDAVNVDQLTAAIKDLDIGVNPLAVSYDTVSKDKITLAGGTDGTTLANVKAGVADTDAVNVSQLKDSGLIGDDGKAIAAVTYDRNADGTTNLGSVTLGGGTDGTTLSNVKAGVDDKDAVNVSQLKGSGLIGDDGKAIAAVTYDRNADGTPNLGSVTLAGGTEGTILSNVKAGIADKDAVNVSQLKGSGLIGDDGKAIAAVTYDRNADGTPNLGSVTLGDGTNPTQIKHVADATDDGDALNLGQLKSSGLVGDDGNGNLTSLAVTYDSATKDTVTLGGGTDGTTLANVKAGVADKDAVNVSQLKGSGLIGDDGKAIAAVTYDRNADGTPNYGSVTLGDGTNPTQLKHVANGTDRQDAVNLGQLQDSGLVAPVDPTNPGAGLTSLAVTYGTNTDGSANFDEVKLKGTNGTTLANVKAGIADTDAVNVSQLKGSGLIGDDGKSIAAVTYDRNTDGTPNYGSVTLGNGTNPTQLKHVADATDDGDALNLGQLKSSGLVGDDGNGNLTSLAVTYDSATKDTVTLGGGTDGTTLSNVKAGVADKDAVNVSQLKGSGLIGDDGKSIAAVTYDRNADGTPNYGSVTLGDGANPTQLKHVANGTDRQDAVNLGQLQDSGLVAPVDPTNPGAGLASLAVTYSKNADDSANFDEVKLKGTDGTTLANVKAGVADKDAVNVSQLKGSGLIGDDGKAIAAVTYDRNTDGTPNYGSVTLGNGTNPTQLKHVADATDDGDALNLGQLKSSGLVGDDGNGNLTSLAVTYDSATKDKVTLGGGTNGTTLANVKAGVADTDAVNVSQLKGSGLIGDDGQAIAAVTYNRNADGTPNYNAVTLGGGKSTGPVTLSNVADGVDRHDAVNLGQLQDSGLVAPVDPTNPGAGLTSLAVTYGKNADGSANFDEVKLKGTNGTTLANVKAGVADTDAVNVSQLKGSGLIGDDGKSIAAVTYDRNTDGTPNYNTVTLGGGKSAGPVTLSNVADGVDRHDAVNVGQLKDSGLVAPVDPTNPGAGLMSLAVTYGTNDDGSANLDEVKLKGANGTTLTNVKAGAVNTASTDAVNGSQLYGVSKSVADSLGGGSTVDASGNVTAPTYSLTDPADVTAKADYRNVGDALDNLDGRVATNTKNITLINNQLADSGLVDPVTGQSIAAVTYDRNADGTPNYNAVTLGGGKSAGPVQVKNVAAGTDDTDAVNVAQLKSAGLVAPVDPTNPGSGLTSLAVTYSTNDDESANFDEVKLKGTNGTTITNVAAGAVNSTSTDAINGSQLHGTAQSVADTIGGGTTVGADGTLGNTAIEVNGQKYSTVAEAVQAAAAYGATDSLAVRYDLNRDGTPNFGSVTLGGSGAAPVRLTNVADGTSQYDAVNYGQLSALNDKIGNLDDRVGGLELRPGTPGDGNGGGTGTNPYFGATDLTAGGSSAANPGTGTGNVAAGSGASIGTGVNNGTVIGSGSTVGSSGGTAIGAGSAAKGENATAIGQGSNATGSGSVAIGSGSVANEANTVSFGNGTDTGNRRIVNIADGVGANDAATKGQLDRAVGGLGSQINDVSKNAYSGIAAATALTMIPGVDPGKTLSFGVGGATYKGYQAVAFGGEARITQNLKMKAGVGLSSGGNTVGMGASYQW
ncbi:YadA-like family protein [Burkholderia metallica]|uniref:YadA-like family protein n=1 Tax=Burkholderia metallica TaxID=488729 RepID=UPI001454011F|nr:YadA-like family protein [Burkholderia metallica]VWB96439.1 putative hemagglutinin-related autotransporter protein [Burkholderia metallica]